MDQSRLFSLRDAVTLSGRLVLIVAAIVIVGSLVLCLDTMARAEEPQSVALDFSAFDRLEKDLALRLIPTAGGRDAISFAAFDVSPVADSPQAVTFDAFDSPAEVQLAKRCGPDCQCGGKCDCKEPCECVKRLKARAAQQAAEKLEDKPASASYPVRAHRWMINGNLQPSKEVLIAHLQSGEHAGKFDPAWLAERTRAELLALHDDDHEGRVAWPQVVQPAPKAAAQVSRRGEWRTFCNGRQCWQQWVWIN